MKIFALILFLTLGGCVDYYPYSTYGSGYGSPTYYYYRSGPPYYHSPNAWRSYRGYDRPWLYRRPYYRRNY